ncbi:MAG: MarR family winged helix-turn-helix transcriptional regulator [Halothermotrichaceae bacterium]
MLEKKIKSEGLDCCIDEIGEMMQGLVRTLHMFENLQISQKGFTNSQCYTLLNLYKNGPLAMKELSIKMNLDTSTMTRIVNNLVRDGYIERKHSQEDRRIVLVELTAQGTKEAEQLNEEVIEYYRLIINQIPDGKVIDVVESINILIKAFERAKPNCC